MASNFCLLLTLKCLIIRLLNVSILSTTLFLNLKKNIFHQLFSDKLPRQKKPNGFSIAGKMLHTFPVNIRQTITHITKRCGIWSNEVNNQITIIKTSVFHFVFHSCKLVLIISVKHLCSIRTCYPHNIFLCIQK